MSEDQNVRTAGEAGWHVSKYNLYARIPNSEKFAVVNLIHGKCEAYSLIELALLSEAETLPENHPILKNFTRSGFIANYDELEAIKTMGRLTSIGGQTVALTICPTMSCNFACPYCFERHRTGIMSEEIQDDVVALTERMIETFSPKNLSVAWFGGEPLLGMNVIVKLSEKLKALAEKSNAEYSASIITNGYLLTQEIVNTLTQCNVKSAQITLDGIGEVHDQTRYLIGGGPTFERITENLRTLKFPFKISIRHNVHKENTDQIIELRAFVEKLAEESGNQLKYYPAPVSNNYVSSENGSNLNLFCDEDEYNIAVEIEKNVEYFHRRSNYCVANILSCVGIDEQGRLYKCWEDIGQSQYSFGNANDWDPRNPVLSADIPANFMDYINSSVFSELDDEDKNCLECMFLPVCAGGCPLRKVRYGHRQCVSFKNNPAEYTLALYDKAKRDKAEKIKDER